MVFSLFLFFFSEIYTPTFCHLVKFGALELEEEEIA